MSSQASIASKCPFSDAAQDFQPFDTSDPFPFCRYAREQAPAFFYENLGYWVFSRHADCKTIFEDWMTFSSKNAQAPMRPFGEGCSTACCSLGMRRRPTMKIIWDRPEAATAA